ncbi:MAG TPA: type II toxin-antitoxin system HigB family toxin [Chitinophagaceae bacterium]|jgi:mRNA interferase HigB|nr:type II toxin-antitoxin system HigB family toxin [Chitinophagaceae bacterium]
MIYKKIAAFIQVHPDAAGALNNWYIITLESKWSNFNEMRQVFGSVDAVGNDLYVFNIRGNKYRLIARIHFNVRTVYIRFIGTHKEYDRVNLADL